MRARAFSSQAAFRAWLGAHHGTDTELLVRCCKVAHAQRGLTYPQALDEALCHGWIDGVRRPADEATFTVRFSPRKPRSRWSAVNLARYAELLAAGLVQPPGQQAYERRLEGPDRSQAVELDPALARRLRAHRAAWAFFQARPPWYRRTCTRWVMSAKRATTREGRLAVLIECSAAGAPVPPLKGARLAGQGTHR